MGFYLLRTVLGSFYTRCISLKHSRNHRNSTKQWTKHSVSQGNQFIEWEVCAEMLLEFHKSVHWHLGKQVSSYITKPLFKQTSLTLKCFALCYFVSHLYWICMLALRTPCCLWNQPFPYPVFAQWSWTLSCRKNPCQSDKMS